jgi:hypothetical protein
MEMEARNGGIYGVDVMIAIAKWMGWDGNGMVGRMVRSGVGALFFKATGVFLNECDCHVGAAGLRWSLYENLRGDDARSHKDPELCLIYLQKTMIWS